MGERVPCALTEPGAAMTALQRAYAVGRMPELPLGGMECLAYFEFRGRSFDVERLQEAVDRVHRHAALRCIFVLGDEALLEDGDAPAPQVAVLDVQTDPDHRRNEIRERLMHATIDIGRGINWGVALSTAGGDDCVLHLVFSLAAVDIAAIGVVLHELAEVYSGEDKHSGEFLQSIGAVHDALRAGSRPRRVGRYENNAPALLPGPELTHLSETATTDVETMTLRRELDRKLWDELDARADEFRVSLASLILAVYEHALRRWSANDDFCVTVAALDIRGTEAVVADRTVAYAHRAFAAADFEQEVLSAATDLRRRIDEHRDVMTEMREAQAADAPVAASRCVFTYSPKMAVFTPLVLEVLGRPCSWCQTPQSAIDCRLFRLDESTVEVTFDIRTAAVPVHVAEAIFELFIQNLVEVAECGRPCTSLPNSQANARKILNSTPPTSSELLYAGFRRQVAERPSAIAIEESRRYTHSVFDEDAVLTNSELNRRALVFAGRIARRVRPGGLVAVQLPRGIDQVVAILGTLYAGCAYLPIALDAPQARLDRIRRCSQWSLLVTAEFLADEDTLPLEHPIPRNADDLAYVIFTSGSTGEPKGVAIAHGAAANTITDINARNGIGPDDAVLGVSGIDFDLSVYDIFGALDAGARLVIVGESETRDPFCWGETVRRSKATVWNSVPMLLEMLIAANDTLPSLRKFLISGDRISLDLPARSRVLSPGSVFIAMGGATEASIWSNEYVVSDAADLQADWPSVPYGRPLAGQKYRVVDTHGRDQPDECIGELMIGGVGVAQGYYRDAERTANAFVEGPDGCRWYRTGDLGVWRGGLLFIVGREDTQVKIRGHRVECGEVESRLCDHPAVTSAAVVPIRDRSALAVLYVPADSPPTPDSSELTAYLASCLPWYMVPAVFRPITHLPMTANGKVDRGAVTALVEQDQGEQPSPGLVAGSIQSMIAESWARVLGRPVDADDNFFALGGDSLAATRMCAQLRETGLHADLANLFRAPVLTAFADTCRSDAGTNDADSIPSKTSTHRIGWRERAAAENASLSSFGLAEWCRWVWKHELGMHDVSEEIVDDADFFVLGGDSLTGARVCAVLRLSGVEASIATLFRHPRFDDFWRNCSLRSETGDPAPDLDVEGEESFDLTPLQLAYALGSDGIPGVVCTSPCIAVIIRSDDPSTSTRWERVLDKTVACHEVLRLVRSEDWRQRIITSASPEFAEIPFDLTDDQFRDLLRRTDVDAFAAPAVRAFVRRAHPGELGLVFNYLALDSLSVAAILRDLAVAVMSDGATPESPRDIDVFRRYALTRSSASNGMAVPVLPAPNIPMNAIPESSVVFDSRGQIFDGEITHKLQNLARRHGVTLNSVLLHAYSAALAAATDQQRLTVNIPTANRPSEAPNALGQFSELALCECGPGMNLREIHAQLGAAIAHAGTNALGATTQRQRYPVVFTSLLGSPLAEDLAGGHVRITWTHTRTPAVLVDCQVMPIGRHRMEVRWDYPQQVIPEDFIATAFTDFIERVLSMADEDIRTGDI
ncbi:non-ribosomal peptide synthetase [uncultured Propionibacterium sp.]|uniref:non-ribosomal peptide synthetase n=1 Tax=uncultured Propionibacterium sp. TaxID=218066 RepID=UPI0029311541|nr:non-ribosomal peptide synthetase [uncultured Propionibacterium sp.]